MDTKSTVAIVCIVIALVLLISMTIVSLLKAWKQVTRKLAEREKGQTSEISSPHTYENNGCNDIENAIKVAVVPEDRESARSSTQHGQTMGLHIYSEVSCTGRNQGMSDEVIVHEESNDTSF